MPKITITIPDGERSPDGSIDCWEDAHGNWLYVQTDNVYGFDNWEHDSPPSARITITQAGSRDAVLADLGVTEASS